jgi:hypothetical protein
MKVYQILRRSVMSMIIHGAMIGGGLVMVASALTPVTASARSAEDFYFTNNTGPRSQGCIWPLTARIKLGVKIVFPRRWLLERQRVSHGP